MLYKLVRSKLSFTDKPSLRSRINIIDYICQRTFQSKSNLAVGYLPSGLGYLVKILFGHVTHRNKMTEHTRLNLLFLAVGRCRYIYIGLKTTT